MQALTEVNAQLDEPREVSRKKLDNLIEEEKRLNEDLSDDDECEDKDIQDLLSLAPSSKGSSYANKKYKQRAGLIFHVEAHLQLRDAEEEEEKKNSPLKNANKLPLEINLVDGDVSSVDMSQSECDSLESGSLNEDNEEATVSSTGMMKRTRYKTVSPIKGSPFKVKWGNYDTMKNRWNYILPQVRSLTDSVKAPSSSHRFLTGDRGERVDGNFVDYSDHYNKRMNATARQHIIHMRTENILNGRKKR